MKRSNDDDKKPARTAKAPAKKTEATAKSTTAKKPSSRAKASPAKLAKRAPNPGLTLDRETVATLVPDDPVGGCSPGMISNPPKGNSKGHCGATTGACDPKPPPTAIRTRR